MGKRRFDLRPTGNARRWRPVASQILRRLETGAGPEGVGRSIQPEPVPLDCPDRSALPKMFPHGNGVVRWMARVSCPSLADDLGMRPLMAHCYVGLGTLYCQIGQSAEARTALSAAIELYRAMEMTFWLPGAEVALAQIAER